MLKGHFIPCQSGSVFVCQYGEQSTNKAILLLPSFFEEMNLCRAVAAKQARYLASKGYTVYAIDYAGTGDSEGELIDASANIWQQDIKDVASWLKAQGIESIDLWAIRGGCLLAFAVLADIQSQTRCERMLLWKPVLSGKMFMSQFLRLKQVNAMINAGEKTDWRKKLIEDGSLEIAGYQISKALYESIEGLMIPKNFEQPVHVSWMELASTKLTPAINNVVKAWPQDMHEISFCEGPTFWQIPEIFEQADLHLPTLELLEQAL